MENKCSFHPGKGMVNSCELCERKLCEECWKICDNLIVCLPCRKKIQKKKLIKKLAGIAIVLFIFLPITVRYRVKIGLWIAGNQAKQGIKSFTSEEKKIKEYEQLFLKGKSMKVLQKFPAAIISFKKCVSVFPNKSEAYQELGECYIKMNMYKRAKFGFKKVIEIEPGNIKASLALSEIYWNSQEKKRAEKVIEDAERFNKNNVRLLKKLLAFFTTEKKYYNRAVKLYTRLIKLEPDNDENYYNRGIIYKKRKKWNEAIADLEKAIKLDPSYTKARVYLARSYYEKGDCKKAFASLDSFRKFYSMINWGDSLIEEYRKYKKCSEKRVFKGSGGI